ncbi:2-keto-4-pentenoate hydratase [Acidisoma cladoniae]|jgi:2-keto-4-pentenoate hydratase|uniref:2-keto-4-pentenoate hydratase n=1 Tax=Acidisoma cladoniae TaxID=3040935 RepID=UPI002550900F|nr:2-keto-4-pentenoate hydratase [Acidisoma sp. PAMC 29798]
MTQPFDVAGFAARLCAARAAGHPITCLPEEEPPTEAEAYAVQHAVNEALGPIGGWKVGAGPDGRPSTAPLPASGIMPSPAVAPASFSDRLIEAEIAFTLTQDLPPRGVPYNRDEVIAAIGACHAVIELVQFRVPGTISASPLLKIADHQGHGALIVGAAVPGWTEIDFPRFAVTQEIEGLPTKHGVGNPAGDMIRLIVWLANEGSLWAGGLKAGQIVTCGSWTGATPAPPGSSVSVTFQGVAPVQLRFAP